MEARVLVRVGLADRDLPLLRREDLAQLSELPVGDALRGERRDRRLDDASELDDVRDRVAPGDEGLQGAREVVGCDLPDERPATGPRLDDAAELERPKRFTDRCAGDLELVRERALRRELIAWTQLAALDERLDLRDDPLVELGSPDRLDARAQGGLLEWRSGGLTGT